MPKRTSESLIDGNRLLRDLRLPYWTFAQLRDMRAGEAYNLFDVAGPPVFGLPGGTPSEASASVERVPGGLVLSALWMLHVGASAHRRAHVLVPGVRLAVRPGRQFAAVGWDPSADNGLRLFIRVVRFAHRLADLAEARGDREAAEQMRPVLRRCDRRRLGVRVAFLDALAGPVHAVA